MGIMINVHKGNTGDQMKLVAAGTDTKKRNSIFAGDLKLNSSSIDQKKKTAQEKALKVVANAWEKDQQIEQRIEEKRNLYREQLARKAEAGDQIKSIQDQIAQMKDSYGVTDDSVEEQDLLLYQKQYDANHGISHEPFTDAERARLQELEENPQPLTDYQKNAMELYQRTGEWKKQAEDATLQMEAAVSAVTNIKLSRLQMHTMTDANKQADSILEATRKEVLGMLMEEGKDNIDQATEDRREKAEQAEEEKKKIEEISASRQEKQDEKNEQEILDQSSQLIELDQQQKLDSVGQSLTEIKNKMALLEADLKGIQVDTEV